MLYPMRNLMLVLFISILWLNSNAQNVGFNFGIKAGFSQTDYGLKELFVTDPDDFKMVIEDSRVGFHGGIALQLRIKKFILQPEVLVNTINVNYKLTGRISGLIDTILAKETIRNVDIPLMIGFKSGVLRLNAGPVGHLYLDSSSDLFKVSGYSEQFNKMQWGWQAGMGLDIWKITIDLRYEGNFSKFGDHIKFGDKSYSFSDNPTRLIGSIGIMF
jgi:hypothetical protein